MNEIKKELIKQAQEKYKDIAPCSAHEHLDECFTLEGEKVFFWFNTPDRTTHLLVASR